ncbi:MAG TPA: SDR family NAD(P)-dependent oxidoreductase, partial [Urbifossiella sp.]|nr:SDR family NAD(P)-dependent oxidoreductase [Urbifossiella sp.]
MPLVPIAVTGVSVLFPGSTDTAGFWRDVLAGKDLITDVPPSYWATEDYFDPDPKTPDRTYSRRGGFIPRVPFDPLANGMPPNVLPATDNAQLLSLIVAERTLADALSHDRFPKVDRARISVILGATGTTELISHMSGRIERPRWEAALRAGGLDETEVRRLADRIADQFAPWQENTFPGFLGNVIAGRITNRLDLGGTNCVVDAACASSLAALRMAVQELATGDSDLVLTGGVDALNVPLMYMAFSKTGALSRSGDCRPYSDGADGTLLGDGVGMVALRRLADAERDGDRIYAVLRGLGSSSDGRAKSIYAPVAEGQARAVRRAYESAGFSPSTVELVEGHGTGTTAGDKAEVAGLTQGFSDGTDTRRQRCALGSIKSQIGHLKGAAGVAGLFKAVMALHHKVLPPTIKVDRPSPALDIANTPFYLNTRLRPWVRAGDHPRRAAVSAAGFGGTNFHLVLEEYTGPAPKARKVRPASSELVLASARDAAELATRCEQLLQDCEAGALGAEGLQRIARRSQNQFGDGAARVAVVASDLDDLTRKLRRAADAIRTQPGKELSDPSGVYFAVGKEPGEVAFVFPGQGSQYVGMGQDLALHFDDARAAWDCAADLEFDGTRLHEVVFPPPAFDPEEEAGQAARLTRTEWAQPALAACSMATLAVLRRLGVTPAVVAGHSFGELSALCAAGAFELPDLIRAARRRGELMAAASTVPGAMTAVRASTVQIRDTLDGRHPNVLIANRNGPRQVVLSGPTGDVAAAEAELAAATLAFKRLPVSTAFHSPLVSASVEPFHEFLTATPMQSPRLAVYGNTTAEPYPADADEVRGVLARQLACPVRFEEMVQSMARRGVRTFVEVGAGGVLTGLVGECLPGQPHLAVPTDRKNQSGLTALWHCLGQFAVNGMKLNWGALWQDHAEVPPPAAPPAHAVMIGGASKGRQPEAVRVPAPGPASPATAAPVRPVVPVHSPAPIPDPIPKARPTTMSLTQPFAPGWPDAIQAILHETAKAHETHQTLMAESCQRYFESVERILLHTTGGARRAAADPPRPVTVVEHAPAATPMRMEPQRSSPPAPVIAVPKALVPPAPALVPPPQTVNVEAELIRVVADKTGYPADLLTLDADMESDLGIDSIKRVEILSAVEGLLPGAAKIDPSQMLTLRTLGDVLGTLRKAAGTPTPVPTTAPAVSPAAPGVDLGKELVRLVADKTGYPAELLTLDADMESDLGIDSIKRVEILSALEAAAPALAKIEPSRMLTLRTLGDVLRVARQAADVTAAVPSPTPSPSTQVSGPTDQTARPAFTRYEVRVADAPASGFAMFGLRQASPLALVSPDGAHERIADIALSLAEQMRACGLEARVEREVPPGARGVIFLGGLYPVANADQALQVQRDAFRAARAFAQSDQPAGVFVTVQDTGGDFGVSGCGDRAWLGGLAGLVKTAAAEWPDVAVKAIDLEQGERSPEALAAAVLGELLEGGSDVEVGLRAGGRRVSLACTPAPVPSGPPVVADGDVVVVSGGARGVTAAALRGLTALRRPRLVLLGRTPLQAEPACCRGLPAEADVAQALLREARAAGGEPTLADARARAKLVLQHREVEENIAALRQAGAEVRYLPADVRDRAALAAGLEDVRREWGPVRGIIHGAGVLADRLIKDKTVEQLDQVFSVKLGGLRALLAATASDPLKLICLFSSVAGRFGNPGQSDYSMANEVLNKVAGAEARRRGDGCLVKSINWGAWEGGMVTPALRGRFAARGVRLLPLGEGGRLFAAELTAGAGGVEVVLGVADGTDPLNARRAAATEFDVAVGPERTGFLSSHCVEGDTPVLPVVLVLEWFMRVGRAAWPDRPVCCRDLKVLTGAPLRDFERGMWFR